MLNGALQFDYNNMLAERIGDNGVPLAHLERLEPQLQLVEHQMRTGNGAGADFLGFLTLPNQSEDTLNHIQQVADQLAAAGDRHVILGIGGSFLGAKALIQGLCHPYHNERTREERQGRPRIYFEGNNLDSDALQGLLDLLPQNAPTTLADKWTMNVISKSGGTIETAAVFRLLRQLAESHYGPDASRYIVATTDESKGQLKNLADQAGYQTFVIPDNVGGRYSVLTPVGLLPAAVAGVNIHKLVAGARAMADLCQQTTGLENPACLYAGLQYLAYRAGKCVSVMNIWDKALEYVGFWYDQLCAESLGKDGLGRVPLTAVSTRDLHARGQQIQDGMRNAVITNLFVQQSNHNISLKAAEPDLDQLNYLEGKTIHEMLTSAFQGTNFAYTQDRRPNVSFTLKHRSAYHLGALFYLLERATVLEGYLMAINPLDQPGVEDYKNFMFGLLGRADRAAYRDQFSQRPPENPDYVV